MMFLPSFLNIYLLHLRSTLSPRTVIKLAQSRHSSKLPEISVDGLVQLSPLIKRCQVAPSLQNHVLKYLNHSVCNNSFHHSLHRNLLQDYLDQFLLFHSTTTVPYNDNSTLSTSLPIPSSASTSSTKPPSSLSSSIDGTVQGSSLSGTVSFTASTPQELLFEIVRDLLLLNNTRFIERLFSTTPMRTNRTKDNDLSPVPTSSTSPFAAPPFRRIMALFGCLEHDPYLKRRVHHRRYLLNHVNFKDVCSLTTTLQLLSPSYARLSSSFYLFL